QGNWAITPKYAFGDEFRNQSGRWLAVVAESIAADHSSATFSIIDVHGKRVFGPTTNDIHWGVDENNLVTEDIGTKEAPQEELISLMNPTQPPITAKYIFRHLGKYYPI